MKQLLKYAALAALALTAVSAMAQQGGGQGGGGGQRQGGGQRRMMGMGGMQYSVSMLVRRSDVRDDIALTDDQKDKLRTFEEAQRAKMMEMFRNSGAGQGTPPNWEAMRPLMEKAAKESDAEVAKILTADQIKRLKEIKVQLMGKRAATDEEVQKDLALTEDQKKKITTLSEQAEKANAAAMSKMGPGADFRAIMETVENNNKLLDGEIEKILTDAQKTKLTELGGKKFEARQQRGGGFGGGRPGGGGN